MRIQGRGLRNQLTLRDIQGSLYGGIVTGAIVFNGFGLGSPVDFTAKGSWSHLDFKQIMQHTSQEEQELYRGNFSGNMDVSGLWGARRYDTYQGQGSVNLQDGYLFKLPLLGGLSKWLARLYPGLGFSSQTEFNTNFTFKENKIHTEKITIEGRLLSLQGQGTYAFDETLDFLVVARPLGESALADWVRKLAFPISSLLKFRLTGTLEKPEWKPESWPQELLGILNGDI